MHINKRHNLLFNLKSTSKPSKMSEPRNETELLEMLKGWSKCATDEEFYNEIKEFMSNQQSLTTTIAGVVGLYHFLNMNYDIVKQPHFTPFKNKTRERIPDLIGQAHDKTVRLGLQPFLLSNLQKQCDEYVLRICGA